MKFKLGRLPRARDPRVPHLSAMVAGRPLPPAPLAVDWAVSLPADLGVMLNDQIGDCTCAAFHHLRQVWTADASGKMLTASDGDVEKMYRETCGYSPADPSTDRGGVEQDVLAYLLNVGAPVGATRDKILAYFEVDPRNLDDVKRVIHDCGGIYIGFEVPSTLWDDDDVWHTTMSDGGANIEGGHAVACPGYDMDYVNVVSWGRRYRMTWSFWARYVDECYALVSSDWLAASGRTPIGMAPADLEAAMAALRPPAQRTSMPSLTSRLVPGD